MYTSFSDETWRAFRADNRPGPIQMLNLIRLRERAEYPDGRLATGLEAYAEYSRISVAPAQASGMRIVWRGGFEMTVIGPAQEQWDICFVAEYPDVEAFVGLMRHADYRAAMVHRQAAVADSRLVRLSAAPLGQTFLGEAGPTKK
jgi:uncharacterized protein (DUF1330 family)